MLLRIDLLENDFYRTIETSSIYSFALFLKEEAAVEVNTRHGERFYFRFKLPRYAVLFYIFCIMEEDYQNVCFSDIIEEMDLKSPQFQECLQRYKLEDLIEGM